MVGLRILASCLVVLFVAAMPAGRSGAADAPAAQAAVQAAIDQGLESFVGKSLSVAERTAALDGLLRRHSDPAILAAGILGRYWAKLSDAEQKTFTDTFMRYLESSFVGMMQDVTPGVAVVVGEATPLDGGKVRVASMVRMPANPAVPVPVDWDVVDGPGGRPVIIDVMAEGVSLIRAMREDFASVLRASGGRIEPLMDALGRKIAENDRLNAEPR